MIDPAPDSIDELPRTVSIFPLSGALLLPRGHLPLRVFEPRYLNMMNDAMGSDRMIGMIQPRGKERQEPGDRPRVFETGCLGRITSCDTAEDERLKVMLTGLCRFDVVEELASHPGGYRQIAADYGRFADDLKTVGEAGFDRGRLRLALRGYLTLRRMDTDWQAIQGASDDELITALAMLCPFRPSEKQALLECHDLTERGRVMTALIEMALVGGENAPQGRH